MSKDKSAMFKHWMKRFGPVLLALGLLAATAWGQRMTPDTPVKNFRLPSFGEDGYRVWDLEGKEGLYVSETEIKITGMKLRTWSGDEDMLRELEITSPSAKLYPAQNIATGEDLIHIVGLNYTVFGKGWRWNGAERSVTVDHEVRVTFYQEFDVLR